MQQSGKKRRMRLIDLDALPKDWQVEDIVFAPEVDAIPIAHIQRRIEDDEQIPETVPEPVEEPARRKNSVDHDEIIRMAQEGCTPREIAEKIGCSEQTVCNHIARG